ncbi:SGNH/GDSL hydrolase family protein [Rhizobium hidalgonense]|uniref:SGNH/GDSL hydrolase family protein n=1 Tax=Rhizobium hidalgonense TaxID=1538159 RepID=A0AAJ2H128_9HYPH|nr:SGNH/GDSL hydrolase family protein [Rhizobium hidalgonense]MDR9777192.1 SGNH/GDSL hydrolase family protein [Rhizobium hidalgonense]
MTVTHTKRALVLGDSISSLVYADSPAVPDANKLWVHQLAQATGINVQSLSAPGNRVSVGSAPDFSLRYNSNAFNLMRGTALPAFVIITAGTNDYAAGDINVYTNPTYNFHSDYRWILSYWKSNGVPVLVVHPLWRSDEATAYAHPDGAWPMSTWRTWISTFAAEKSFPVMQHTDFGLTPADFVHDTPTLQLHMNGDGHDKFFAGILLKLQTLGWV